MLLDLLGTDNYISFNIKVANVIGLHAAIYVNEITNINAKAIRKEKLEDGFITLDRTYIQSRTTLPIEEQYSIDKNLNNIGAVELKEENPDKIKLNIDILTNIIASEDVKLLKRVTKLTTPNTGKTNFSKMSMRQRTIAELKDKIKCDNEELREAYKCWIDGVYARPNGFLSARAISIFQKGVDDFAKRDLDLALKIIDIATVNGLRDVTWAIDNFNKNYAKDYYKNQAASSPTPTIKRTQLSSEVF